jgi:hypothetical protein
MMCVYLLLPSMPFRIRTLPVPVVHAPNPHSLVEGHGIKRKPIPGSMPCLPYPNATPPLSLERPANCIRFVQQLSGCVYVCAFLALVLVLLIPCSRRHCRLRRCCHHTQTSRLLVVDLQIHPPRPYSGQIRHRLAAAHSSCCLSACFGSTYRRSRRSGPATSQLCQVGRGR